MNESTEANDAQNSSSSTRNPRQNAWFGQWLREGFEKAAESSMLPENATRHFREARLEFLRGVRELIDYRIERLSKDKSKGSRIVVE